MCLHFPLLPDSLFSVAHNSWIIMHELTTNIFGLYIVVSGKALTKYGSSSLEALQRTTVNNIDFKKYTGL